MAKVTIISIVALASALVSSVNAIYTKKRYRYLDQMELDGSLNIKFSQCVDVKLKDDDLFSEDVVEANLIVFF